MNFSDLIVIFSIILMEGLLSVDNSLVIASLAIKLPKREQHRAICLGIGAGAVLRVVALALVAWIVKYPTVKLIGAGYLIVLAIQHLCFKKHGKGAKKGAESFKGVVVSIMLADIAFSTDNIVVAVGMSPKFLIVVIGVLAGIAVMLLATQLMVKLLNRYPLLEWMAYVIVGFVGITIILAHFGAEISEINRFLVIIVAILWTIVMEENKS